MKEGEAPPPPLLLPLILFLEAVRTILASILLRSIVPSSFSVEEMKGHCRQQTRHSLLHDGDKL
jgi:hypothetical protein